MHETAGGRDVKPSGVGGADSVNVELFCAEDVVKAGAWLIEILKDGLCGWKYEHRATHERVL